MIGRNLFSRYDQDAKLTVYFAFMLASHRRKADIGDDDFLLALTWRQHAPDCAFRKLKDDFAAIWEGVGVSHLPITAETYELKKLALSKEAKQIVLRSAEEADRDDEYWIDIDHLLRAIVHRKGLPAKVLQNAGWDRERIVAAGAAARVLYPSKAAPLGGKLYLLFHRFRWLVWTLLAFLAMSALFYLHSQNDV